MSIKKMNTGVQDATLPQLFEKLKIHEAVLFLFVALGCKSAFATLLGTSSSYNFLYFIELCLLLSVTAAICYFAIFNARLNAKTGSDVTMDNVATPGRGKLQRKRNFLNFLDKFCFIFVVPNFCAARISKIFKIFKFSKTKKNFKMQFWSFHKTSKILSKKNFEALKIIFFAFQIENKLKFKVLTTSPPAPPASGMKCSIRLRRNSGIITTLVFFLFTFFFCFFNFLEHVYSKFRVQKTFDPSKSCF